MRLRLEPLAPRCSKIKIFAAALFFGAALAFPQDGLSSATEFLQKREWRRALEVLQEAESAGGFDDSLYALKGVALYETGDFSGAIECFSKMAQVEFADKAKWNFDAGCAATRLGDAVLAEEFFSKSILANKKFAPSYLNRALLRASAGKFSEAADDCKKYLKFQKDCDQKEEIEGLILLLQEAADQNPKKSQPFGTKIFPPVEIVE